MAYVLSGGGPAGRVWVRGTRRDGLALDPGEQAQLRPISHEIAVGKYGIRLRQIGIDQAHDLGEGEGARPKGKGQRWTPCRLTSSSWLSSSYSTHLLNGQRQVMGAGKPEQALTRRPNGATRRVSRRRCCSSARAALSREPPLTAAGRRTTASGSLQQEAEGPGCRLSSAACERERARGCAAAAARGPR